jgi:hypothetical protein
MKGPPREQRSALPPVRREERGIFTVPTGGAQAPFKILPQAWDDWFASGAVLVCYSSAI